jgi:hypothetical protein
MKKVGKAKVVLYTTPQKGNHKQNQKQNVWVVTI